MDIMRESRRYSYGNVQVSLGGNKSESKGGYGCHHSNPERSSFERTPQTDISLELSPIPKLMADLGGLGIFEFVASSFSERVLEDPTLDSVYGGVPKDEGFLLLAGLLLFCLGDNFQSGDQYRHQMIEKARESPVLNEHYRLGLMNKPQYFSRLVHHLKESLFVCRRRKSIPSLVSRFSMLGLILQGLDEGSLATAVQEHRDEVSPKGVTDIDTSSFHEENARN